MYAIFLDAKSHRTYRVDEYNRDRSYWEERGRIDTRKEEEAYNRRRQADMREAKAEGRWSRNREKEMDDAVSNFSATAKRKPPKFK